MSTGNIDDVNAPRAMKNIVQEVMDYVERHQVSAISRLNAHPIAFSIYDDALAAVWPELHKASSAAHTLVAISVYIEIAERWGFEVPDEIKRMKI